MQKETTKPVMKPIKLLISIVARGKGSAVSKTAHKLGAMSSAVMLGRGTAASEILDILGIGGTEKDVVICTVYADDAHRILTALADKMHFEKPGSGIAFTLPIQSVGGMEMFLALTGQLS